jgi:hypothetical protein
VEPEKSPMKSNVVDCPLLVILPQWISHEVIFVEFLLFDDFFSFLLACVDGYLIPRS